MYSNHGNTVALPCPMIGHLDHGNILATSRRLDRMVDGHLGGDVCRHPGGTSPVDRADPGGLLCAPPPSTALAARITALARVSGSCRKKSRRWSVGSGRNRHARLARSGGGDDSRRFAAARLPRKIPVGAENRASTGRHEGAELDPATAWPTPVATAARPPALLNRFALALSGIHW